MSTPSDLLRFGLAASGTLLRPESIQQLQTPQRLSSGEKTGYGLGWELETLSLAGQPTRMAGHGSRENFMGATTSLMTFPERGIVVAVMTNISFADTKSIALNIAQAFAEEGPQPQQRRRQVLLSRNAGPAFDRGLDRAQAGGVLDELQSGARVLAELDEKIRPAMACRKRPRRNALPARTPSPIGCESSHAVPAPVTRRTACVSSVGSS